MGTEVIGKGTVGPIRWQIEYRASALGILSQKDQNRVIARSMERTGKEWGGAFLHLRFTDYVDRMPFNYPRHRDGFYVSKARRMGMTAPIFQRLFAGWDPWSANKPPFALIEDWKKKNPGKYVLHEQYSGLINDLRNNAKRMTTELVLQRLSEFMPLVESGLLRKTVLAGVAYRATATATKSTLRISMPRPAYPQQITKGKFGSNPRVNAILGTLPHWEVSWFAKRLGDNIDRTLKGVGYTVLEHGGATATPRRVAVEGARAAEKADERRVARNSNTYGGA